MSRPGVEKLFLYGAIGGAGFLVVIFFAQLAVYYIPRLLKPGAYSTVRMTSITAEQAGFLVGMLVVLVIAGWFIRRGMGKNANG